MRTLKETALELLDKYTEDEDWIIFERSTDMVKDMNELREIEMQYKQEIEEADKREHVER